MDDITMTSSQTRSLPNILICGTPSTGKSTLASAVIDNLANEQFTYHNVGDIAKQHKCFDEYDEEYECHVLNEDLLLDEMEPLMHPGGCVVDYHGCEFFPERWFDLVVVLRCSTEVLFDRLQARGYNKKKLASNVDCEIFQSIAEEARESYNPDIIIELSSNTTTDVTNNVDVITNFINNWCTARNSNS